MFLKLICGNLYSYVLSFLSMIVTMDTNVLLAALISDSGASHKILRLIIDERINLAL